MKISYFCFVFPASRTKLMVSSKIRGGARAHAYPQPEGTLGEAMVKFGKDLGEESPFGKRHYFHLLIIILHCGIDD